MGKALGILGALCLLLSLAMSYSTYKEGRRSMYRDMVAAAGGQPGSLIQVLTPMGGNKYHEAGICAACHKGDIMYSQVSN